jgi:hypothetical protein
MFPLPDRLGLLIKEVSNRSTTSCLMMPLILSKAESWMERGTLRQLSLLRRKK